MKERSPKRLPGWLRKAGVGSSRHTEQIHALKRGLRAHGLKTVCEEARCPNLGECFARNTATIMIMGDTCTRSCSFCAVKHGPMRPPDTEEPARVARQVRDMGLSHAVITSVTRDDLADGGASHFAETVRAIRQDSPGITVEVLTPDFEGRGEDVATVCRALPDVFNHNIETVRRLAPSVRDRADYTRSLDTLKVARALMPPDRFVKSGLMVGLGESDGEVEEAIGDLASVGCNVVTIGQYLRPTRRNPEVARYVEPQKFREYELMGLKYGIKHMICGPFVRSSYLADKVIV